MEALIKSCAIEMTCACFKSRKEKSLRKYIFSKIQITIEEAMIYLLYYKS